MASSDGFGSLDARSYSSEGSRSLSGAPLNGWCDVWGESDREEPRFALGGLP